MNSSGASCFQRSSAGGFATATQSSPQPDFIRPFNSNNQNHYQMSSGRGMSIRSVNSGPGLPDVHSRNVNCGPGLVDDGSVKYGVNRYASVSDHDSASTSAATTSDSSSKYSMADDSIGSFSKFKGHHAATLASSGPIRGSSFASRSIVGGSETLRQVNDNSNRDSNNNRYLGSNSNPHSHHLLNQQQKNNKYSSEFGAPSKSFTASNRLKNNFGVGGYANSSTSDSSDSVIKGVKGILNNLILYMNNSKYFGSKMVKGNRREIFLWILLVLLILCGYKFCSDGSFSAVLTLASAFQCFSVALLAVKVFKQKTIVGISVKTLYMIIVCLSFRLISTAFYNGYLPVDRSGDWVYQFADVVTVLLTVLLVCYSKWYLHSSVQQQNESDNCYVVVPAIAAFVLSLLVHPSLNQNFIADVAWTFGLYLETLSMIPQLFMMGKLGGEIESLNSHFVASMAASKFFVFLFWFFSFKELAPRGGVGANVAGWAVIICYVLQLVLYADFLYYYVKSIKIGKSMIINI